MERPVENPGTLFWNLPIESLQSQLEATQAGLSQQEARARSVQVRPQHAARSSANGRC